MQCRLAACLRADLFYVAYGGPSKSIGLFEALQILMYRFVYVSSAVGVLSENDLNKILEQSRRNNMVTGITGMLLYKDGNFMQCLEGPKDAVLALEAKLRADPRHEGMIVLLREENVQPEFSDWSMGFAHLQSATTIDFSGYSHFLDTPLTSEQFLQNPTKSLKLLLSFKKVVR